MSVVLTQIFVKPEDADWKGVFLPSRDPVTFIGGSYVVDPRDASIFDSTNDKEVIKDHTDPRKFEGYIGWSRRYTTNNILVVDQHFSNAAAARIYFNGRGGVSNTVPINVINNKKAENIIPDYQVYWSLRNRATGQEYQLGANTA